MIDVSILLFNIELSLQYLICTYTYCQLHHKYIKLLVIAIAKCKRANILRLSARCSICLENFMNYPNLRECRLQVSHVSVIDRQATQPCIILGKVR